MTDLAFLLREIGGNALGDFLTTAVHATMHLDHMPERQAYQWVTDRADAGDPLIIAAAGQIWLRRADTDPDEAPVRRLFINERRTAPAAIHVTYLDVDEAADRTDDGDQALVGSAGPAINDASKGAEFPVALLDLYELESWRPADVLLPTPATTKADAS